MTSITVHFGLQFIGEFLLGFKNYSDLTMKANFRIEFIICQRGAGSPVVELTAQEQKLLRLCV